MTGILSRAAVALAGAWALFHPCTAGAQRADSAAPATATSDLGQDSLRASAAVRAAAGSAQVAGSSAPTAASPIVTDSLGFGGRVIAAGETVVGPVVVAGGNLDVRGRIEGTAVAIAGNVIVREGATVTGDAIAAFGEVRTEGGTVGGAARSMTGMWGRSLRSGIGEIAAERPARSAMSLALGWFGVMLLIGLGVLVFASSYLNGVVDVLEQSFWRSFVVGIAGELGVIPALLLLIVALAITVIGALLIPFAVVAFVLAIAGLLTLGFIAVARVTGEGFATKAARRLTERGGALRAVLLGVSLYMGVWVVAAALGGVPAAGTALRVVALVVTYVALTAGFGAAILSRAGTRRDAALTQVPAPAMDAAAWQTPTPVHGVVAARRPVAKQSGSATG